MHALRRFWRYLITFGRLQEAEHISDAALQGQGARSELASSQHGVIEEIAQWFRQLFSFYPRSEQDTQTLDSQAIRNNALSKHEHDIVPIIHGDIDWTTHTRTVSQLEQILHRAIERREVRLGPYDSKTLEAMRAVAILRWIHKRDQQAELAMRATLQRCEHALGKCHLQILWSMCDLAIALSGRTTEEQKLEAQILSQAALFRSEDRFDLHHHKTVACYNSLMRSGLTHWTFTKERRPPFTHVENVGSGGYSIVNSVQRVTITGEASTKVYAQKTFRIPSHVRRDEFLKVIQNEIDVIRQLKHSHIVLVVCTYQETKHSTIILSPLADEDLENFLYRQNTVGSELLNKGMITGWFYCLAKYSLSSTVMVFVTRISSHATFLLKQVNSTWQISDPAAPSTPKNSQAQPRATSSAATQKCTAPLR